MTDFTMQKDADGVAVITWDVPGKSINVLSLEGAAQLDALIDDALSDEAVKGIVITSGKKDFAAGMDLNVIAQMKQGGAQQVFDGIMTLHHALRKIERAGMDPKTLKGGKPVAAALPGTALGIGLELPLALWIDFVLPKQRILEIYLNIAEMGPAGQFGAEAGAQYAFGRSAAALSPREAALLAAILPNPLKRSARNPGPGVRRLSGTYMARANTVTRCWRDNRGD